MKKHRLGLWLTALALGLTLFGTPAFAAPAASPPSTQSAPAASPTETDGASKAPGRASRYAQREAATPRAADFKGNGAGIYIGGSTLAVVLLVVLIVVLI